MRGVDRVSRSMRDALDVRLSPRAIAVAVLLSPLGGCRAGAACRGYLGPALRVKVLGSDGAAVCDAVVLAADGGFKARLRAISDDDPGSCLYFGPTERPGSYSVTATSKGRSAKASATVRHDGCHVETADLTIHLS